MGLLDWFRRKESDEPDIIPLPSLRPLESPMWCIAVFMDAQGLTVESVRGREFRVEFHELDRVAIRTTDEGPGNEDVFWLLVVGQQECLIPHGSLGEGELFERLLKLPGFDSQAMIAAMTSTENAEFECWIRGR